MEKANYHPCLVLAPVTMDTNLSCSKARGDVRGPILRLWDSSQEEVEGVGGSGQRWYQENWYESFATGDGENLHTQS